MFFKTVKNVAGSWLGLGTTMVVGFLLTPFILHRLGNTALGLWVLITAFTGYYGMLDLGIRNAFKRAYRLRKDPTAKRMNAIAKPWAPYRSVASWYLWQSLELPALERDKSNGR